MVRYTIYKDFNDYGNGLLILKDNNGKPRTFTTESEAKDFLRKLGIPEQEIETLYHIQPYVI